VPEAMLARGVLMLVSARGLEDLDAAIAALNRALPDLTDPLPARHLLAAAYQARFTVTARHDDLDDCVRHLDALVAALSSEDPRLPEAEAWLGLTLAGRHLNRTDPGDAGRAKAFLGRALGNVAALPEELAERVPATLRMLLNEGPAAREDVAAQVLRALGQIGLARREARRELADRAISGLESVLAALSTTDPWHPRALRALGDAWCARGVLREANTDLRRGYELIVAADAAAPRTHPDRAELRAAAARARVALTAL
jgi:tetratricopeptide (TPR) repeat protein